MQVKENATTLSNYALDEFVEAEDTKQAEMEALLRDSKLEEIMSPFYLIFNVKSSIIGI